MKKCYLLVERLPNELRLTHLSFWVILQHHHRGRSTTLGTSVTALSHRLTLMTTSTEDDQRWAGLPKFSSKYYDPLWSWGLFYCFVTTHMSLQMSLCSLFFTLFLFCLFRNRTGGKRTSFSWKQRVFMLLLVGVLGFFTLIIIMAKLGRASAGSDPNLDPLLNPHIRVGKNWWRALIPSPPPVLHNVRLCRWSWNGTVHRRVSPAEGAVYPTWME